MTEPRIFEELEEAYERGYRGSVQSFDLWLTNLGINPRLFNEKAVTTFLRENLTLTVNRANELETLVEFVGFFSKKRQGLYHLPIIGVTGIGKSHLVFILAQFLTKAEKNLTWKMLDATELSEVADRLEDDQPYHELLDDLKTKKYDVLIIDSCERGKAIEESLREIVIHLKSCVLITSWTPYHWDYSKDSIEEFIPTTKEVHLEPLDQESSSNLLSEIFKLVSNGNYLLKDDVPGAVCEKSGGIPLLLIAISIRMFHEAFFERKPDVDLSSVVFASRTLRIEEIQTTISKLTDYQLHILRLVLLNRDERGMRPSNLVDLLGKDKGTISYHLAELSRLGLLTNQRAGRWVFYRIPKSVEPFIGQRLVQEGDYLA